MNLKTFFCSNFFFDNIIHRNYKVRYNSQETENGKRNGQEGMTTNAASASLLVSVLSHPFFLILKAVVGKKGVEEVFDFFFATYFCLEFHLPIAHTKIVTTSSFMHGKPERNRV